MSSNRCFNVLPMLFNLLIGGRRVPAAQLSIWHKPWYRARSCHQFKGSGVRNIVAKVATEYCVRTSRRPRMVGKPILSSCLNPGRSLLLGHSIKGSVHFPTPMRLPMDKLTLVVQIHRLRPRYLGRTLKNLAVVSRATLFSILM